MFILKRLMLVITCSILVVGSNGFATHSCTTKKPISHERAVPDLPSDSSIFDFTFPQECDVDSKGGFTKHVINNINYEVNTDPIDCTDFFSPDNNEPSNEILKHLFLRNEDINKIFSNDKYKEWLCYIYPFFMTDEVFLRKVFESNNDELISFVILQLMITKFPNGPLSQDAQDLLKKLMDRVRINQDIRRKISEILARKECAKTNKSNTELVKIDIALIKKWFLGTPSAIANDLNMLASLLWRIPINNFVLVGKNQKDKSKAIVHLDKMQLYFKQLLFKVIYESDDNEKETLLNNIKHVIRKLELSGNHMAISWLYLDGSFYDIIPKELNWIFKIFDDLKPDLINPSSIFDPNVFFPLPSLLEDFFTNYFMRYENYANLEIDLAKKVRTIYEKPKKKPQNQSCNKNIVDMLINMPHFDPIDDFKFWYYSENARGIAGDLVYFFHLAQNIPDNPIMIDKITESITRNFNNIWGQSDKEKEKFLLKLMKTASELKNAPEVYRLIYNTIKLAINSGSKHKLNKETRNYYKKLPPIAINNAGMNGQDWIHGEYWKFLYDSVVKPNLIKHKNNLDANIKSPRSQRIIHPEARKS